MLREVRRQVLPAMTRKHPLAAWIVDDTGFTKKGTHSAGVARQYWGDWASRRTAVLRSACHWPPSRRVSLWHTSYICLRSGRKIRHDETRLVYRKKSAFKLDPRLRSNRSACWSKRMCRALPCWPTPPMATTTGSATDWISWGVRRGCAVFNLGLGACCRPASAHGSERDRKAPKLLLRDEQHQPLSVKELALCLSPSDLRRVSWREGTRGTMHSRFSTLPVRVAHRDYWRSQPREE